MIIMIIFRLFPSQPEEKFTDDFDVHQGLYIRIKFVSTHKKINLPISSNRQHLLL